MTGPVSGIKAPQSAAAREYLAQRKEIAALKALIAQLQAQLAAAAPAQAERNAVLEEAAEAIMAKFGYSTITKQAFAEIVRELKDAAPA